MVILSLPLPNNIQYKLFQDLRTYLSADSYLWSLHLVANIVKAMFKSIVSSLIFPPCCKYTYSRNNVKFLKSTSSELRRKLLKLNRIAAASTCCFTFELFLQCELNYEWLQTRQPFPTIFHVKFFIQVLFSLNFLCSLHFEKLKLKFRDSCSAHQNPICNLLKTTLSNTCKWNERLSYMWVWLSPNKLLIRERNQPENEACVWLKLILLVFQNWLLLLLFRAGQFSLNFVPGYSTMTSVICSHSRSDFSM